MKKLLLTLLAVSSVMCGSARLKAPSLLPAERRAQSSTFVLPLQSITSPAKSPEGPQKASGTLNYTLAGEPYSATTFNNISAGYQVAMAFEISKDVATAFAGNTIDAVTFYSGVNETSGNNNVTLYTAFVTNDLGKAIEPLSTKGGMASRTAFANNKITLDTPVTIEADTKYYVGVYASIKATTDYVLVFDYLDYPAGQDQGGWAGIRTSASGEWTWINATADLGNFCLGCTISGNNLPENMAFISDMETDLSAYAGSPFEVAFLMQSKCANDITSIEFAYKVGNEPEVTKTATLTAPLAYDKQAVVVIDDAVCTTPSVNETPVTVRITKVNDSDNLAPESNASRSGEILIIPEGKGFTRNAVVEEGTSIWCQYCPYGIIAFDRLKTMYPDGDLGLVAVHTKFGNSDPMTTASYQNFINYYISAFPTAWLNRYYDFSLGWNQAAEEIADYFEFLKSQPSPVGIDMTCEWTNDNKTLTFKVNEEFSFDYPEGSPYRLSFAITEDNVGPYNQVNALSGNQSALDGWGQKPNPASTMFDDVARYLDTYAGINGSVPAVIEAGKSYEYVHNMTVPTTITNKANVNALCYVLDTRTGVIHNVATVKAADITGLNEDSGLTDVIADTEAPVEYFNLQGIRVANPEGGVFIRRQGNAVTKVIR
ncbi:MAG: hypothetical protein J1E29_05940 [Duncaniella sp.]|nr:hypothetical protein [Duncaniella sp.]